MTDPLEFGYHVPRYAKYEDPEAWKELATTAEQAGFETLWRDDHITLQGELTYDTYQFGEPDWARVTTPYLDVFQALTYLGTVTDDIAVGTNVCIAPLRHPVILTKHALSIDALTSGRFEFGIAVGWLESEFEVLDVPFHDRGSLTDEFLDIFQQALTEGEFSFEGPHHQFRKTGFYPRPADDGPRIWIGGLSGAAFRRVAEYGDGWTIVKRSPDDVATAHDRLMNAWTDYGRSGNPDIAVRQSVFVGRDPNDEPEIASVGSPAEIRSDIESYVESGTTHFTMSSLATSLEEELTQIERFGSEIIPHFAK